MVMGFGKVGHKSGPGCRKWPNGMEGDANKNNGKTRGWHTNEGHISWHWQDKVAG